MESEYPINFLYLGIGFFLLIFGRKLFWLFVGGAGFAAGLISAPQLLGEQPNSVVITVALVLGACGALAAIFLKKIALRIAGFICGTFLAASIVQYLEVEVGHWIWIYLLLGGLVGLLLVLTLFEWSLIILSSITGSLLFVQSIPIEKKFLPLCFVLAALIGMLIQIKMLPAKKKKKED